MTRKKGPRHLEKVGDVWYYLRAVPVALRGQVGTRRFKEALSRDLIVAEQMRDLRDAAVDAALRRPDGYVTLRDFAVHRWLKEQVGVRRDPKGQSLARVRMDTHILPMLGELPLSGIRRQHVRALVLDLMSPERQRPLSVQTVKHVLADLLCCLRYAHLDCELIDRVPSTRGVLPKMDESVPDPVSAEDFAQLTAAATPDEAFVLELAAWTGMRMAEIDRAHRRHVWLGADPSIDIPKTKSHKARRVPLMEPFAGRLRAWLAERDSVLVSPLRYGELARLMRNLCRRCAAAGFPVTVHFHQLRDTFGCRWLAAGGGILELQEIYGHSDLRLTQRYARLMAGHVAREASRIGAQFEKVSLVVTPATERALENTSGG